MQGFSGNCLWCLLVLSLCARVLKEMFGSCHYVQGFYRNVVPCVATCKGFKGNVELLSLCARVLWKCDAICGYVQGF